MNRFELCDEMLESSVQYDQAVFSIQKSAQRVKPTSKNSSLL